MRLLVEAIWGGFAACMLIFEGVRFRSVAYRPSNLYPVQASDYVHFKSTMEKNLNRFQLAVNNMYENNRSVLRVFLIVAILYKVLAIKHLEAHVVMTFQV